MSFIDNGEDTRMEYFEEFGCSSTIRFNTSKGIKTIYPGKSYDKNLDEINKICKYCGYCGYPKLSPHKLIFTCSCN